MLSFKASPSHSFVLCMFNNRSQQSLKKDHVY